MWLELANLQKLTKLQKRLSKVCRRVLCLPCANQALLSSFAYLHRVCFGSKTCYRTSQRIEISQWLAAFDCGSANVFMT